MAITIKCYATLSAFAPEGEIQHIDGRTVADLIGQLHIDIADVKVIFINGVHATAEQQLHDGDRVGIFPAVGGG